MKRIIVGISGASEAISFFQAVRQPRQVRALSSDKPL